MTDTELADHLDRLADAATPGPWHVYCPRGINFYIKSGDNFVADPGNPVQPMAVRNEADVHFIAALDPATVKRLTAALRRVAEFDARPPEGA